MLLILGVLLVGLGGSASAALEKSLDCPEGMERVQAEDPFDPFPCRKIEKGRKGLRDLPVSLPSGAACPQGFRPVATSETPQAYRCVSDALKTAEPGPRSKTRDCPQEESCEDIPSPPKTDSFRRYALPGEFSFEYPRNWTLIDHWSREVPSLSLVSDPSRQQWRASILLQWRRPGQEGYQDMEHAILKEKEWREARELPAQRVAGLAARRIKVEGRSLGVYLPRGNGYYLFSFQAPGELYDAYRPVFSRLLETFRFSKGEK